MALASGRDSIGRCQINPASRKLAAWVVSAEPLKSDGAERRRTDSECLESGLFARGHIVLLQHQPLVTGEWRPRHPVKAREQISDQVRHGYEIGLLTGYLKHRPVQIDHAHELRTADFAGLAAKPLRIKCGQGDRLAKITNVDWLEISLAGNDR